MILYAHHLSSHCRKVLLSCEEIGIDYAYRGVDAHAARVRARCTADRTVRGVYNQMRNDRAGS